MTFISKITAIFLMITATSAFAAKDKPLLDKILKRADRVYRSASSFAEIEMSIINKNWQRKLRLKMWTKGMKKTFIYIQEPKKDAGIATLRKDREMWNYFPKINKVIKIPPSMMMGSWMGSDFTNDDLVKETTFIDDYQAKFLESTDPKLHYIELVPKSKSTSMWGKIELKINKPLGFVVEQKSYNERGELARTIVFSEVKKIGGRTLPTLLTLESHKKKGSKTIIKYLKADFTKPVSDQVFTRKNLQKRR